ncbi:uncharacterized protein MONOS_5946 [Monocercomonoides exilis]|uniref:uncharacterized protein n=1 Tax=Monocercomonoides exilis TaxID=2049356 RepID=UPI00355A383D|nr:hypothetical protein MONOS_5946 [Monocercomonoides exilis]|eukprot:MONOS_5946.1-p1 / transcript=MONOS_5946.1 / gene=MONOS_5946 / organism=Monocercomonoides_exilis_PA203 / gene_product=unspecified product / transcript_product=unspecified product / location=Mono_scaffold00180:3621-4176(+) / protein_length=145 / sequence_SO=supercontig / SO=protein_coding / is_pseudo=false
MSTDYSTEGGHRSDELRHLTRTYSLGAKIGNWFEDYALKDYDVTPTSDDPAFKTMYKEQTQYVAERSGRTMDRTFQHATAYEPFPESEMRSAYRSPKEQTARSFKGQRSFTTDKSAYDHYVTRWTRGPTGETQTQVVHRDFRKK